MGYLGISWRFRGINGLSAEFSKEVQGDFKIFERVFLGFMEFWCFRRVSEGFMRFTRCLFKSQRGLYGFQDVPRDFQKSYRGFWFQREVSWGFWGVSKCFKAFRDVPGESWRLHESLRIVFGDLERSKVSEGFQGVVELKRIRRFRRLQRFRGFSKGFPHVAINFMKFRRLLRV